MEKAVTSSKLSKLPATVVCINEGAFQGCYALTQVVALGCVNIGRRAFAECCSLQYIGTNEGETNELVPGVNISSYVFESCPALSQVEDQVRHQGHHPLEESRRKLQLIGT